MKSNDLNKQNVQQFIDHCQQDPLFFSEHVIGGEQPWEKQIEIMLSVRDNPRTAVPSGFSVGKTWIAGRTALWFLYSFPNSLVVTTAPTARQVEHILWAEIRRQHHQSVTPLGGEILKAMIKISDDWFAIGLSTDEPDRFQGFHSAHLLLIFDEAAGVDKAIWDIAQGQLAGSHARWLAIGNPVAPSGPFYDACKNSSWNTIPISCTDSPNAKEDKIIFPKLVTPQWIQDREAEWGKESPLYQTKVLGQFPTASEYGLIPLDWIFKANQRAKTMAAINSEDIKIGIDVARSGADSTVFIFRKGSFLKDIEAYRNLNVMEVVGRLIQFVEKYNVPYEDVFVDEIGIGAGVVDRLHEQRRYVQGVNFGRAARDPDDFRNIRAECYWRVREALNPESQNPLAIPKRFGRLASELAAIEWTTTSTGKTQIESKEEIKKRLGYSPDYADALALSFTAPRPKFQMFVLSDDDIDDDDSMLTSDDERIWNPIF